MKFHPPSLLLGGIVGLLAGTLIASIQHMPAQPAIVTPPEPPVAVTAASATPPQQKPDLVLDLFEPDSSSLSAQQGDSAASSQIEHALVVSFVLTRCHLITQQEYSATYNDLITFALRRHMAADIASAADRVHAIAKSAGASYALVYSRVPCSDKSLPPLVVTLRQWLDQSSSRTTMDNSSTP